MTEPVDLRSVVFELRAAPAADGRPAPEWWGRAAHAFFLDAIRRADPALAAALHDAQGPKPFTCSTLSGRCPGGRLAAAETYILRLTALDAPTARILGDLARAAQGETLELDRAPFRVAAAHLTPEAHPWAGATSYAALAAARLAGAEPERQIGFTFVSPTAFKSQGRHVPIPLPDLVFGSLLERWNARAPAAFPAEVKRYAAECLAISRYDLASRYVPGKEGGLRMGGMGAITFTTLNYDRYWMGVLLTLADFALYAGVGAGTTMGMGQCRRST